MFSCDAPDLRFRDRPGDPDHDPRYHLIKAELMFSPECAFPYGELSPPGSAQLLGYVFIASAVGGYFFCPELRTGCQARERGNSRGRARNSRSRTGQRDIGETLGLAYLAHRGGEAGTEILSHAEPCGS